MTFNPWTFLFEALNFLVLAFVLHRLLYRPLREAVQRRQQEAAHDREEAERMRREAEALQQKFQQEGAAQEQERQKLLQKAHEQAETDRKNRLAEAEKIIRARQEEAHQVLQREREECMQATRKEAVALALDLARRLLAESADRSLNRQLVLRLGQTLRSLSPAEQEQVRHECQPEDGVLLETAEELDAGSLHEIGEAAAGVLGRAVTPEVRVRPELIAGARLRLGSLVWDGTLDGPLRNHAPAAGQEKS